MKLKLLAASAMLAMSPALVSAQSVDLTITGSVVPTSCTPSLSGGGVVGLGRHSASTLARNCPRCCLSPMRSR